MSASRTHRRGKRWADGIEGAAGATRLSTDTTDDGCGKMVINSIVDALTTFAGKWTHYEGQRGRTRSGR